MLTKYCQHTASVDQQIHQIISDFFHAEWTSDASNDDTPELLKDDVTDDLPDAAFECCLKPASSDDCGSDELSSAAGTEVERELSVIWECGSDEDEVQSVNTSLWDSDSDDELLSVNTSVWDSDSEDEMSSDTSVSKY